MGRTSRRSETGLVTPDTNTARLRNKTLPDGFLKAGNHLLGCATEAGPGVRFSVCLPS
jgi:hypothetical protein